MSQDIQRRTILVVDDEEVIRNFVKAILEFAGYDVLAARDGSVALSLYSEHQPKVALLLTDHRMPGMTGLQLAGHLRTLEPRLPVLVMSGTRLDDGLGFSFVAKPFTHAELVRKTAEVLDSRQALGA